MIRWVACFIVGDGSDDWQLIQGHCKEYFDSKEKAMAHAAEHVFKKKPIYWQPEVWAEESYELTTTHWRRIPESRIENGEKK